jgi:AbrB family looped-hinge helix DNA binding protein
MRFILKVGRNGAIRLPSELLKLLNMREGDHLEFRVVDNRIVSGISVSENQPFDAKTVNRMLKRLDSSAISSNRRSCEGRGRRKSAMADKLIEIKASKAALDELGSLSPSETDLIISFLKRLQANPYDPSLIEGSLVKGDLFASNVADNLYVYWSLGRTGPGLNLTAPLKISILGLKKKAARGIEPELTGALKPA